MKIINRSSQMTKGDGKCYKKFQVNVQCRNVLTFRRWVKDKNDIMVRKIIVNERKWNEDTL